MNAGEYQRLQELFEQALELDGPAREAFLERECAGAAERRENLERLLAHEASAAVLADGGASQDLLAAATRRLAEEAAVPLRELGRYRIQRQLAEGGMGTVYLAEQDHPRRRVALKVIRPGVLTGETLRRFEFEAELLGRLQHPGIAQIYEAGEADTGSGRQPYFAMEYVDGVDLVRYAAIHALDVPARLELLARICDAVHHAHQKGIVHRDLKPGNILVAPAPTSSTTTTAARFALLGQPKILDFGVSRLVHGRGEATQLTLAGHVLGTPAYMSPEQARGALDLDTRSDVYALGVIGFELLSGRLPHEVAGLALLPALQRVQQGRAPTLGSIDARFRGDLSVILGKALEPEPERRYASAAALGEDLRRYLQDQPINARPPTVRYLLARFVRRNTALVASSTLAFVCLAVGLVLALRAQREEAKLRVVAERQTEDARRSAYAAQTQAAMAYARSGDRQAARRLLATSRADLRGWEWEYLSTQLDDDLEFRPMSIRPACAQLPAGATHAVFAIGDATLRSFDLASRSTVDHEVHGGGAGLAVRLGRARALLHADHSGRVQLVYEDGARPPLALATLEMNCEALVLAAGEGRAAFSGRALDDPDVWCLRVMDPTRPGSGSRTRLREKITSLALSPDGERVAIGLGQDGVIAILDAGTLERRAELRGHRGHCGALCFSPTGRYLASAAHDRSIHVWSMPDGQQIRVLDQLPLRADVLAFGQEDACLLSGHDGARIRRWNLDTGVCEKLTSGPEPADPDACRILQLGCSGADLVVAVCTDGIRIRPLGEMFASVLQHGPGDIYPYAYGVEFSPCERILASSGWEGCVRFWDVATGRQIAVLPCAHQTYWLRYAPDGRRLLASAQHGFGWHHYRLYDAVTLAQLGELGVATTHPCGTFVPRANTIVLGAGAELLVVDAESFAIRERLSRPAVITAMSLGPKGTWLALGAADGRVTLLDAVTLAPGATWPAHEREITALAWSPHGNRLATGGTDDCIRVFDVPSSAERLHITSPGSQELFSLCFTPDGRRLLSGSRRSSIGVWDASSGLELLRLHGHWAYVHELAMTGDARVLASASGDNTVRLWDARPLAERIAARDRLLAAERALEGRVTRQLAELGSLVAVLAANARDPALSPLERHAAWTLAHRLGDGRR